MKYTFKNEIKCSNNMKVYYKLAVTDYTLTKKVEVMVQDECGRLADSFSISLKQLVTCKSVLSQFFDYGFSHEDVVKITEKLKRLQPHQILQSVARAARLRKFMSS